ncbi:unnamed protein product [Heligmosomoides polygyrus]|uniref:FHA domain-containing protein n=1 Tax=Heligmosomoides polygyrus TaxID=6339 RepID=A0A3P8A1Z1_HELPZ|nr:unnamed protein product [Heligmosomoides polygyrus]
MLRRYSSQNLETIPMHSKVLTIGTTGVCDVKVNAKGVHPVHASIEQNKTSGSFWLKDHSLAGRTTVNGQSVHGQVELQNGDLVRVGRAQPFVFEKANFALRGDSPFEKTSEKEASKTAMFPVLGVKKALSAKPTSRRPGTAVAKARRNASGNTEKKETKGLNRAAYTKGSVGNHLLQRVVRLQDELTRKNIEIDELRQQKASDSGVASSPSKAEPYYLEIERECDIELERKGFTAMQRSHLADLFRNNRKEYISTVAGEMELLVPVIREACETAGESIRVCSVFTEWSRHLGEQMRIDGITGTQLLSAVDDLKEDFYRNRMENHWLLPSISPILSLTAQELEKSRESSSIADTQAAEDSSRIHSNEQTGKEEKDEAGPLNDDRTREKPDVSLERALEEAEAKSAQLESQLNVLQRKISQSTNINESTRDRLAQLLTRLNSSAGSIRRTGVGDLDDEPTHKKSVTSVVSLDITGDDIHHAKKLMDYEAKESAANETRHIDGEQDTDHLHATDVEDDKDSHFSFAMDLDDESAPRAAAHDEDLDDKVKSSLQYEEHLDNEEKEMISHAKEEEQEGHLGVQEEHHLREQEQQEAGDRNGQEDIVEEEAGDNVEEKIELKHVEGEQTEAVRRRRSASEPEDTAENDVVQLQNGFEKKAGSDQNELNNEEELTNVDEGSTKEDGEDGPAASDVVTPSSPALSSKDTTEPSVEKSQVRDSDEPSTTTVASNNDAEAIAKQQASNLSIASEKNPEQNGQRSLQSDLSTLANSDVQTSPKKDNILGILPDVINA